jgi:hypothetical protein
MRRRLGLPMCKWDSRLEPGLCWLWFPCTKPFPVLLPCKQGQRKLGRWKSWFPYRLYETSESICCAPECLQKEHA